MIESPDRVRPLARRIESNVEANRPALPSPTPTPSMKNRSCIASLLTGSGLVLGASYAGAVVRQDAAAPDTAKSVYPDMPAGAPPSLANENAIAASAAAMKPYVERIAGTSVTFEMVAIPAGSFVMGSPETEADRKDDEGPQHPVAIEPFWMGKHEVSWDEFQQFQYKLDQQDRHQGSKPAEPQDAWADAVSRPTPPYVPMDFGMGVKGFPAVCMTQFAARYYTKWLSMKTGRFYRLPTEAEWEYACRAGTTTAYSFGESTDALDDYAWHFDNSDDTYHELGRKKPNPWGLFDMHGNVAEWVLDRHDPGYYATLAELAAKSGKPVPSPLNWPDAAYPHVARGGSFDDDADRLRSAARRASTKAWKVQDPQVPKSIWYLTDAKFVGFRVVRPLVEPSLEERAKYWEPDVEEIRTILAKQRKGGR